MNKIIYGLVAFTAIDLLYTTVGAFYGGGGAELNPLFAWIHDPIHFIIFIAIMKIIIIGTLIWGIWRLDIYERRHHFRLAKVLGLGANVAYGCMMFGILGLNVWYQLNQ